MSSVVSAPAPSGSASCTNADFTVFPTQDIACAVISTQGIPSNTSDALKSCCKSAPVEPFNGASCGLYCLSVQQSVAELQACYMDKGVRPADIRCNGNNSATASSSPSKTSGGSGGNGASETGGAASGSSTPGAAVIVGAPVAVSKAGLGMLGMIVVSVFAGAML